MNNFGMILADFWLSQFINSPRAITLLTGISVVPGSNPERVTNYPDLYLGAFRRCLYATSRVVSQIIPRLFPSKSFSFHFRIIQRGVV